MKIAQVVGVDPGLVHTGVVSLAFDGSAKVVTIDHTLIAGPDATAVAQWLEFHNLVSNRRVFVEQYRPRQRMDTDVRMVQAEQDMRREIPSARFLPNMGVKRIIPQSLMEVLGVWTFKTSSHHQDLRSAARIALFGMFKDDETNGILADVVRDHLANKPWTVSHV